MQSKLFVLYTTSTKNVPRAEQENSYCLKLDKEAVSTNEIDENSKKIHWTLISLLYCLKFFISLLIKSWSIRSTLKLSSLSIVQESVNVALQVSAVRQQYFHPLCKYIFQYLLNWLINKFAMLPPPQPLMPLWVRMKEPTSFLKMGKFSQSPSCLP